MIHSTSDSEAGMRSNSSSPVRGRPFALSCAALILGAGESAITYDAMVGLNWALLALGAALAIPVCSRRPKVRISAQDWGFVTLVLMLATALGITADRFWQFLIATALMVTLSVPVLGLLGRRGEPDSPLGWVLAPFRSLSGAFDECARRMRELLEQLRADASIPIIRAVSLCLPVVAVLALLLSGSDPTLAAMRDAIAKALAQISIIPHTLWFGLLSALTLGGLGLALRPRLAISDTLPPACGGLQFSRTDQLAVLGSAATLFAAYLALQVSYLFANSAALPGSHVTYAEAVHRGFGQLNAAVTLSALIIYTLSSRSAVNPLPRLCKAAAIVLIVESQVLAISALHRVRLYEEAYGYTEQRLLVEVYSGAVMAVMAMLGWETLYGLQIGRLARRTWVLGVLTLCAVVFWNHEAWIVHANMVRYRQTGRLDAAYLIYGLGPDGLPELTRSLTTLEPSLQAQLQDCIRVMATTRYGSMRRYRWFEWTTRRKAVRQVLGNYPHPTGTNRPSPASCRIARIAPR